MQANRGFTLLELLVVIAIIGLIATVVIASLNSSRERSRNVAVVSQMYEYQKALNLYYLNNGAYPNSWPNNPTPTNRDNIFCIGRDVPLGTGLAAHCVPNALDQPSDRVTGVELDLVPTYISEIVHMDFGDRSSPAYRGCSDICSAVSGCPATRCTPQDYSLFYMLEGNDQDCGKGVQIDDGTAYPGWTWCQISSAQ